VGWPVRGAVERRWGKSPETLTISHATRLMTISTPTQAASIEPRMIAWSRQMSLIGTVHDLTPSRRISRCPTAIYDKRRRADRRVTDISSNIRVGSTARLYGSHLRPPRMATAVFRNAVAAATVVLWSDRRAPVLCPLRCGRTRSSDQGRTDARAVRRRARSSPRVVAERLCGASERGRGRPVGSEQTQRRVPMRGELQPDGYPSPGDGG
jgi:hypothetical protein